MNLQSQLQSPYSRDAWLNLLRTLFSASAELFAKPVAISDPGFHGVFTRVLHLGDLKTTDSKTAALLDIEVAPDVLLPRNRAGIRHLAARLIDGTQRQGILAAFHNAASPDWRFSFIAREKTFDLATGTTACRETPARRFTYLLGPAETCRTAAERFATLQDQAAGSLATFANLETAFSVEKLSDAFFTEYISHYETFAKHAARFAGARDWQADTESARNARHFSKRLLARLVFLHFLQKKHWIGCSPASAPAWADGDTDFLHHRFQSCPDPERFHTACLIPLFYETLNSRRPNDIFRAPGRPVVRIPYLNGGLFEENPAEKPFRTFDFPAKLFQDLFDLFSRFNFTIDESDPLDIEIGVDPEMLGRIFEALLEDNKEKGAYYTPKAIVAYMCQEALIRHLHTHLTPDATAADLEAVSAWIRSPDKSLDPGSFVKTQAARVDRLLRDIKICDPAIGSGAFPMGMLQEIVRARLALNPKLDPAALKAHTIQNSIYGVDLDSGAVDIARLRFWLSLVVDEHEPRPLPNLDYKIMQGNSLLESFEGVDLSRFSTHELRVATQIDDAEQLELFINDQKNRLKQQKLAFEQAAVSSIDKLVSDYFSTVDPEAKKSLRQQTDAVVRQHIEYNFALKAEAYEIAVAMLEAELARRRALHKDADLPRQERRQLEEAKTELHELPKKRRRLEALQEAQDRPYFLWHLFFHDVLSAGGFDILIGNPPYLSHDRLQNKDALKVAYKKAWAPFADIYCYFAELGINILRNDGILAFITSNSYIKAEYGLPMRRLLGSENTILSLVNIEDSQMFDAAIVNTAIVIAKKGNHDPLSTAIVTNDSCENLSFPEYIRQKSAILPASRFAGLRWILSHEDALVVLDKIKKAGPSLKDRGAKIRLGIATGANEAFVVDAKNKDLLVAKDRRNNEILKPIIRGRDIARYVYEESKLFLILAKNGIDLRENYPSLLSHLDSFGPNFKRRGAQGQNWWNLRACDFYDDFKKEKIVWIELTDKARFALCKEEVYCINSAYFMIPPTDTDSRFILGILNSRTIDFFVKCLAETSGMGTTRWINSIVAEIPIPVATPQQQSAITALVDRILATKTAVPTADVSALESQIEHLVYALYNLTPEEIALIEGAPEVRRPTTLDMFTNIRERFVAELAIRVAMRYPGLQVNDYANAVGLLFSAGDALATYIVGDPQKTAWKSVWQKAAKGRSFLKGAGVPNIAQLTADLRKSGFFSENADTAECRLTTLLEPDATLDAVVPYVHVAWLNYCKRVAPAKTGARKAIEQVDGELMVRDGGNDRD
ncbi:MAG: Eco57I restriction-modification methylase domain-containing protein [Kiritimatiellia bacterium]